MPYLTRDHTGPKRRPGRPTADPSGKQTPYSIRLTPKEAAHVRKIGGSVNAGIRLLVVASMAGKKP